MNGLLEPIFANEKLYERYSQHELGVGEAFFLGLKDTYRGVKQMAGIDLENMERDQQRIRDVLQNGDGLTKAAYFGGLILERCQASALEALKTY